MTTTQNNSDSVTIGLDLGDRRHHYCVLDAEGTIQTEAAIPNTRECLGRLAERFPRARFIMETGTHSPWISRLLEAGGHRVIVANARKLRAISASHTKTDTEDARLLARLGRADPTLLSPVKHRSEATQRALGRLNARRVQRAHKCAFVATGRLRGRSVGRASPFAQRRPGADMNDN